MVILTEARQGNSNRSPGASVRVRFERLVADRCSPSVPTFSNEGGRITPGVGVYPSYRHGFRAAPRNRLLGITQDDTLRNSEERLLRELAINNISGATLKPLALATHSLHSQEHPYKLIQLDREVCLLSANQGLSFDDFDSLTEPTERPPRLQAQCRAGRGTEAPRDAEHKLKPERQGSPVTA
jgi:hypothetical protein